MAATTPPPAYDDINEWVRFYRNVWGINIFPAPTQDKGKDDKDKKFTFIPWQTYQREPLSDEQQEEWIRNGEYIKRQGLGLIPGKVWFGPNKEKWLVAVDADNDTAKNAVLEMFGCETLEQVATKGVVVEQHPEDAPHKAHFYFYSDSPFHNLPGVKTRKTGLSGYDTLVKENKFPSVEIKCADGGIHYPTPSIHFGGYRYRQTAGSPPVPTLCLSELEAADVISKLENILNHYGDSYLNYRSATTGKAAFTLIEEMWKPEYKVTAGNNRHLDVRRIGASELIKTRMVGKEQSLSVTLQWNNEHCDPPLTVDDVKSGFDTYSVPFAEKILKERAGQEQKLREWEEEEEQKQKQQQQKNITTTTKTSITTATVAVVSKPNSTLLKGYNDDYFEYLIDITSKKVKQEDTLCKLVHYTYLSTYAASLTNTLAIRAPSSEGKSYPILESLKVTGEKKDIIKINYMTPKALIYQNGGVLVDKDGKQIRDDVKKLRKAIGAARNKKHYDELEDLKEQLEKLLEGSAYVLDLTNKCFLLLEPPKAELWDLLKAILSHDTWESRHYMTDKGTTGGMMTKQVILRGFPSFIFCSAKDESKWEVWEEVMTRFMFASPNMVQQKYYEGNKLIGIKYGLPNYAKHRLLTSPEQMKVAHKCFEYLKYQIKSYCPAPKSEDEETVSPVWIPYQDQLTELLPYKIGADNRVADRLLRILMTITLCRAHLRDTITFPTGECCVIATFEDLREALHITQNVSGIPPHKLRFYKDIIWRLTKKREAELPIGAKVKDRRIWLTSTEITDFNTQIVSETGIGKEYNNDNITKVFLNDLCNYNYLDKIQDPDTNRAHYLYTPLVDIDGEDLSNIETQQEMSSSSSNLGRFDKKFQFMRLSLPKNHDGFPKNWLELQILQNFDCRIDSEDLKIRDKDGNVIPLKIWVEGYETPQLNLSQFYKHHRDELDNVKTIEITKNEPERRGTIVKIITEQVKTNESVSSDPKFDQLDKNNGGRNGKGGSSGGISIPSQTKSIAGENQSSPPPPPASAAATATTTTAASTHYIPSQPAQQRQMLLVEAYELKRQEQAKVNNEDKTLRLLNEQRNKIPPDLRKLYESSVSVDPEWAYERESGGIRRIYAMSFVDWQGRERVFHINDYEHLGGSLFERTRIMLNDIFAYWFENYRMSFGFNSLGKESDREVIFENAQHFNTIIQPVEEQVVGSGKNRRVYYKFKERELRHTHIDWFRIFKNNAVWTYVFEQKYRGFGLNVISRALFDVGKYREADGLQATKEMSTAEQKMYVLQDSRLLSLLTTAENGDLFGAMQYIADLLELPLPKVCHSQVSQYWTTIYEKMGHKPPPLVEKVNPETGETEIIAEHYYYRTKIVIPKKGKNKGTSKVKVISYAGGRVLEPTPGFYRDVIGLDQESQYPTVSIALNAGFENMCICPTGECENDPSYRIKNTGDPEIDNAGYYICKHFVGDTAYKQRLIVFREARIRAKENDERVKDLALKIIINAAYGVWGFKKWPFADTRLASTITCLARKKHKEMEDLAKAPLYNFEVVGGDTDSLFIKFPNDSGGGALKVKAFCEEFKARYGITVKPSKKQWSKMLITKKKHYIYWPLDDEDNPIIKGMEGAKNNMPKLTNIVFDQLIKNIGADRDFIPDLRRAWLEEYQYCKKHRTDLLQIEVRVGKDPETYVGDKLIKRLAIHQHKDKDDTIRYYEIGKENEKKYGGLDAYLNSEHISDEIYKQKFFISPFEDILEQLGYDVKEVFG